MLITKTIEKHGLSLYYLGEQYKTEYTEICRVALDRVRPY